MIKLAILIPAYGATAAKFTLSLANALVHLHSCNITDPDGEKLEIETEIFMVSCSMLTESRHRLVAEALVWGATHALWMDADHVFPADAIPRLLAQNVDIVGANYARRCIPTGPTAAKVITDDLDQDYKNLVYTTPEKAKDGLLEEVDHMGFGLCMMNMGVFDKLQVHADTNSDGNFMPLFMFEPIPGKFGMIGEDVYFFRKLKAAGAKIYVDHALSWEVGHIHEMIYTNAHTVAQRERWEEASSAKLAKLDAKLKEVEELAEAELVK